MLSELRIDLPKDKTTPNRSGITRNDLIILNIIASNKWKRPIYFTSPYNELGFGQYLRKDGLSYRLVPVMPKGSQQNWLVHRTLREVGLGGTSIRDNNDSVIYGNLMNKFRFGGANLKNIYFDEENRRHLLNIRGLYGEAAGNLADAGRTEEAKKLIEKIEEGILPDNLPYAMVSRYGSHNQNAIQYLEACYKAGKKDVAEKVRLALRKDLEQQKAYYIAMNGGNLPDLTRLGQDNNTSMFRAMITEYQINEALLVVLDEVEKRYSPEKQAKQPCTEKQAQPVENKAKPDSTK